MKIAPGIMPSRLGPLLVSSAGVLGVCVALSPIAWYFGASLGSLAAYLGYVALADLLPGTLVYQQLSGEAESTQTDLTAGWVLGLCLEMTAHDLADRLGLPRSLSFWLYPAIAASGSLCLAVFSARRVLRGPRLRDFFSPILLATLAGSVLLVAVSVMTRRLQFELVEQAVVANGIQAGPPYQYQAIDGVPLLYNYLIHNHVAAASAFTGVPVLELAGRSVPFCLTILGILSVYSFGLGHYGDRRLPVLVIAQVFGLAGGLQGQRIQMGVFGSNIPGASVTVFSTLAAFSIFFTLTTMSLEFCTRQRLDWARPLLIIVLLWSASGTRMPALVMFAVGTAALALIPRSEGFHAVRAWILVLLCAPVLLASLRAFYGFGTPFSATKFMAFGASPAESLARLGSFRALQRSGLSASSAGWLAFALVVFGQATFLIGGVFWLWRSRSFGRHPLDVFWTTVVAFGALALGSTYAEGGSHFTFMHYGHFAAAFLGARGLLLFWDKPDRSMTSVVVVAVTLGMAALQFGETGSYLAENKAQWRRQSRGPLTVAAGMTPLLLRRLRAEREVSCPAAVVGAWNPDSSEEDAFPYAHALAAEVPGLRLLGSPVALRRYLVRHQDSELQLRIDFMEAMSRAVAEGITSRRKLQNTKKVVGLGGCVLLIAAYAAPAEADHAVTGAFRDGRFVAFRLD